MNPKVRYTGSCSGNRGMACLASLDAGDCLDETERGYQRLLSWANVFDFPMDKPELHPAYDFFTPGPLLGYAGNPNNLNGWIEANVPLLGEIGDPLGAEADEPMVGPVADEIAKPIVEMEEQMVALVIDVEEDIAMLFGDDDFSDDYSKGFEDDEEVIQVSDAKVADVIAIREINPRVSDVNGHVQVMESQMVQAVGRLEQIQQLQALVSEMSSHESTLCILGMDRRLADLERRPLGPQ
ncbi:hypothetical protein Tco_0768120 [Tanacetum coccineum]